MTQPVFIPPAAEIARAAGAVLMRHFGRVRIEYKGGVDLVTAADRESEALIVERLRAAFPQHDLIAEEGSQHASGSAYRWYVDPLDGTTNFAHGLPQFAVSLGLECDGRRIAGVVYNPARDELFTAEQGCGASLNGRPIQVSPVPRLGESLLGTGFPTRQRSSSPNILFYYAATLRSHGVRRLGAAALDLCYAACGRFEGFWEFGLKPWDMAAGACILDQAGGQITDLQGEPFSLQSPAILASNGLIHDQIRALFAQVLAGEFDVPLPRFAAAQP